MALQEAGKIRRKMVGLKAFNAVFKKKEEKKPNLVGKNENYEMNREQVEGRKTSEKS